MKRVIRFILWLLVLIVVVCLLAFTALYLMADPNKLKPALTQEVMKRTGYKVVLDGDLSWSLYPKIGVRVDHLTVTAPKKDTPFLDLSKVSFAVEPIQLLLGTRKLSGEVHIAAVKLMHVNATSALVGVHWHNNTLELRPIQASMYGGSMSGTVRGKDFSDITTWGWEVALNHVKIGPLLADVNGKESKLTIDGNGQVLFKGSTKGATANALKRNLNGNIDFSLRDGMLQGVDINYFLLTADNFLSKKKMELPDNVHQTSFETLVGSALISNGIAQTNNLLLSSQAFKVNGQGSYNLPSEAIDMALKIESKNLNFRWQVPVLVTGKVTSPDVRLDMSQVNQILAARELKEVKQKVKSQIKKRIPGKAGAFLQELIGN